MMGGMTTLGFLGLLALLLGACNLSPASGTPPSSQATRALSSSRMPSTTSVDSQNRGDDGSPSETYVSTAATEQLACGNLPSASRIPGEVQGTAVDAELWALVQAGPEDVVMTARSLTLRPGRQIKIVWRMTGSGQLHLYAENGSGRRIEPAWGPIEHSGSTWDRPGDEWGSGFVFPNEGCWHVHAARDSTKGIVRFWVSK